MGAGTEKGGSQGLASLLASVSGYKTGRSALLESRLNTSHSPMGRPGSGAAAFSPRERILFFMFHLLELAKGFPSGPWYCYFFSFGPRDTQQTLQNTCLLLLALEVLPEAESSPSEPLRISKLFSSWLSTGSSSGILLMISGPRLARTQRDALGLSSSQCLKATFLALRVLPLRLECPGVLPMSTTASVFKLGPFLV